MGWWGINKHGNFYCECFLFNHNVLVVNLKWLVFKIFGTIYNVENANKNFFGNSY